MRCRRAQAHIALLVGDDLDEPTLSRLREHLDGCSACQDHVRQMRGVLDVLVGRPDAATAGDGDPSREASLWPSLSRQLPKAVRGALPAADFNGWYPALAVAAVCLLIVTSARDVPQPAVNGTAGGTVNGAVSGAGAEVRPVWSAEAGIAPQPVHLDDRGGMEHGLNLPAAEAPPDWTGPGMPVPRFFEFPQNGPRLGGARGPGDPLMIYTGDR